jgi:hypothetical protein
VTLYTRAPANDETLRMVSTHRGIHAPTIDAVDAWVAGVRLQSMALALDAATHLETFVPVAPKQTVEPREGLPFKTMHGISLAVAGSDETMHIHMRKQGKGIDRPLFSMRLTDPKHGAFELRTYGPRTDPADPDMPARHMELGRACLDAAIADVESLMAFRELHGLHRDHPEVSVFKEGVETLATLVDLGKVDLSKNPKPAHLHMRAGSAWTRPTPGLMTLSSNFASVTGNIDEATLADFEKAMPKPVTIALRRWDTEPVNVLSVTPFAHVGDIRNRGEDPVDVIRRMAAAPWLGAPPEIVRK